MKQSAVFTAKFSAFLLSAAAALACSGLERAWADTDISGTKTITQASDLSGAVNFANNGILNVQTDGITVDNDFNFAQSGFTTAAIQVGTDKTFTVNSTLNFKQANASGVNTNNILNKTGAGTLILGGSEAAATNSYTFKITEGTLQLGTGAGGNWTSGKWISQRFDGSANKKLVVNQAADTNITRMVLSGGTVSNVELSNIGAGKLSVDFNHGSTSDFGYKLSNLKLSGSGVIDVTTYPNNLQLRDINGLSSSGSGAYSLDVTNTFRTNNFELRGSISGYTGTIKTSGLAGIKLINEAALGGGQNIDLVLDASGKQDTGVTISNTIDNAAIQFGSVSGSGLLYSNGAKAYKLQVGNTIGAGETAVFSGVIAAANTAMSIEKVGKGTWVWTNNPGWTTNSAGVATAQHTYSGNTVITDGALQIGDFDASAQTGGTTGALPTNGKIIVNANAALGTQGTLTFARATDLTIANALEFNGGGIANVNPDTMVTISAVSGTGLVKSGEGAVKLETANYTGSIRIDEGTLIFNQTRGDISKKYGNIEVGANGTLQLENSNNTLGICNNGTNFPALITIAGTLNAPAKMRTNLGNIKLIDGTISVTGTETGPDDIFGNFHLGGTVTAEGQSFITVNALTLRSDANEVAAGASGTFIVNGADSVLTVSSVIGHYFSGNSIKKQGNGTLVLTGGFNDATAVSIEQGSLNLATTTGTNKISNLTVGMDSTDPNKLSKLLLNTTGQSISGALSVKTSGSIWVDASVFDDETYSGETLLTVASFDGVDATSFNFYYDESQANRDTVLDIKLDKLVSGMSVTPELVNRAVAFAESMDSWASFSVTGNTVSLYADSAKVPEPSSLILILLGIAGLAVYRRKKG